MAATAAPDGYTVAQIPITVFRLPCIQKTNYDPAKDFTYIIQVTGYTFGVVVRADSPWKTFNELLDYAKANPDKINYGAPGAGTSLHITMEQIAKQKGIKWTHGAVQGSGRQPDRAARRAHRCGIRTRPAGPAPSTTARRGCW